MEPYLIRHKVRGAACFDIAIKVMIGKEEGWVIPTSGHRAYPYWWRRLNQLCLVSNADQTDITQLAARVPLPEDWPDHYPPPLPKGVRAYSISAAEDIHEALEELFNEGEG